MKKIIILTIVMVLALATVAYAASVDQGHAAVRGWYTSEAFASHNAAMAIMRNPVVTDAGPTGAGDDGRRDTRRRVRYSGG